MFGTPQQQQPGQPHQFQASQNGPFGGQNMFASSMSQPNLFASSGSSGSVGGGAGAPHSMGFGQSQFGTPQGQNFGMSQAGYQGGLAGYNQSPGAFGAPQPASAGPRYMPGYLMKQATPSRPQSHSFGHSLHHQASAEDMANTSLDREANSNSPPHTRGSIFGSASASRTSGSLFNKKGSHISTAMDDDAPPIQSLDDMDELPGASGSTLSPPKLPRTLSSSPGDTSQMHQAANLGTPPVDVPKLVIFGFSRSALPQVIEHLSLIGPITAVETPSNPSANWATITFQETWQAARAIRRNGELIQNGALMFGVKWADSSRAEAQLSSTSGPLVSSSSQFALNATKPGTTKSHPSFFGSNQSPATPQQTQHHHHAPPAVGSPVPILGSAYKTQDTQNASSRWSLGGFIGGPAQNGQASGASQTAINPFAVQQQQQAQQGGVWSKVSDAIFGF